MLNKKYKALEVDFEVPEILQHYINHFLQDLNEMDGALADCYEQEIRYLLNECHESQVMEENQIQLLRDYYVRGGIYEKIE